MPVTIDEVTATVEAPPSRAGADATARAASPPPGPPPEIERRRLFDQQEHLDRRARRVATD